MGMKGATILLLIFSYLFISAASNLNTVMDSAIYFKMSLFGTNKTSTPVRAGRGRGGGGSSRGGYSGGRGFSGGSSRGGYSGGRGFSGGNAGAGHFHGHGRNIKSWSTKRDPCSSAGGVLIMGVIGVLLLELEKTRM